MSKIKAEFLWDEVDGSIGTWEDKISQVPRIGETVHLVEGTWELEGKVREVWWWYDSKAETEVGIDLFPVTISE